LLGEGHGVIVDEVDFDLDVERFVRGGFGIRDNRGDRLLQIAFDLGQRSKLQPVNDQIRVRLAVFDRLDDLFDGFVLR
jgi:hypothetical protein